MDMTPRPCTCVQGPKKSPPQLITATMSFRVVDERQLRRLRSVHRRQHEFLTSCNCGIAAVIHTLRLLNSHALHNMHGINLCVTTCITGASTTLSTSTVLDHGKKPLRHDSHHDLHTRASTTLYKSKWGSDALCAPAVVSMSATVFCVCVCGRVGVCGQCACMCVCVRAGDCVGARVRVCVRGCVRACVLDGIGPRAPRPCFCLPACPCPSGLLS